MKRALFFGSCAAELEENYLKAIEENERLKHHTGGISPLGDPARRFARLLDERADRESRFHAKLRFGIAGERSSWSVVCA